LSRSGKSGAQAPLFLFEPRARIAKISLATFPAPKFPRKLRLVFGKVELFAGLDWARISIRAAKFAARFCASAKCAERFFPRPREIDV